MNTVEIQNITKTFGRYTAVDNLSLTVPQGSVYGFISPNGSGKTTTLRMIMNILYPDSGLIHVFGEQLRKTCTDRIGYMKDAQSLTFTAILPAMVPMFIYFPVAKEPLSSFATWTSLFPPFTPLLMLLRQTTPADIPMWQPCVGMLGVLSSAILFVWAGGRIFRVAILMQGTPPKLANIIRWALRG